MGKYSNFQKNRELPAKREVHPVWRGIGCIILIITPIISWAAASLLLEYGLAHGWPFLGELTGKVRFADNIYQIPTIRNIANFISGIPNLKALPVLFLPILVAFSGIFAVLNAIFYRLVGPPRYTPLDEPAPRVKTKRYTR